MVAVVGAVGDSVGDSVGPTPGGPRSACTSLSRESSSRRLSHTANCTHTLRERAACGLPRSKRPSSSSTTGICSAECLRWDQRTDCKSVQFRINRLPLRKWPVLDLLARKTGTCMPRRGCTTPHTPLLLEFNELSTSNCILECGYGSAHDLFANIDGLLTGEQLDVSADEQKLAPE